MIRKFPSASDPTATYFMRLQDVAVAGLCELIDGHYYAVKSGVDPTFKPEYAYIGIIDDTIHDYVRYYLLDLGQQIAWTAQKAIRYLPDMKVYRHTIIKDAVIVDNIHKNRIFKSFGELL